jgi:hypothetical protein
MNDKLGSTWIKTAVIYFKIFYESFLRRTEDKHEKIPMIAVLLVENITGTLLIQDIIANHPVILQISML